MTRFSTHSPLAAATFLLLAALALIWTPAPVLGHSLTLTETLVLVKADGSYQIDMVCDLDALALGAPPSTDNAILLADLLAMDAAQREALGDQLHRTFERRVRVFFDGRAVQPSISFPQTGTPLAADAEPASYFGTVARLEGRVPDGATTLQVRASRAFPPLVLSFVHLGHTVDPPRLAVERGTDSPALRLDRTFEAASQAIPWWRVLGSYSVIGFHHILPSGLDHVLFVLGLFLLTPNWRPLLYQVTTFTLAHALTLALATLGYVTVSPAIVEPLIALSIAWVAIENLWWHRRGHDRSSSALPAWRLPLIFLLGCLHGLGFAGALAEVGLPKSQLLAALLSFNVGIELGQLTVLAVAAAAVAWCRHRPWYASRVILPASLAIAAVGLWWTFERLLF